MMRRLYENFLDDPEQYAACEHYWDQLVQKIADFLGQEGEWRRWIPHHYADGKTPMERDGNPIYDARCERLGRAFQIIQWPPEGDEVEISAWIKTYEKEYTELPREELVVNLSLTETSARITQDLLRAWMTPTTTLERMKVVINECLDSGSE